MKLKELTVEDARKYPWAILITITQDGSYYEKAFNFGNRIGEFEDEQIDAIIQAFYRADESLLKHLNKEIQDRFWYIEEKESNDN